MPRKARVKSESGYYHIIIRGINKQDIFLEEEDYSFFLNRLSRYSAQTQIDVISYSLMNNHVHLLIKDPQKKISTFMKKLNVSYVYYFNTKYDRVGSLLQDRFKSEPIKDSQQLKIVLRYILQNPQKAGLCNTIDYIWNSFKYTFREDSALKNNIIIELFDTYSNFFRFVTLDNKDICMEYENKNRKTDPQCIRYLKEKYHIENPEKIQIMNKTDKKKLLFELKQQGFSIRLLSRITGLSKIVIKQA